MLSHAYFSLKSSTGISILNLYVFELYSMHVIRTFSLHQLNQNAYQFSSMTLKQ